MKNRSSYILAASFFIKQKDSYFNEC